MSSDGPRIALLHATPVAMEPVRAAMAALWPEAEGVNLLDDSLTQDRAREGDVLSGNLTDHFVSLGHYAHEKMRAAGILVTCSAFGPAIERMAAELPVPVVKPNEAMFAQALSAGRRIAMVATFAPSVSTMTAEFERFDAASGGGARLETVVAEGAIEALRQGDAATHNRLVAAQAKALGAFDAIMLAHFSTSRAAEAVRAVVNVPVLTAPEAAVQRMQSLLGARAGMRQGE